MTHWIAVISTAYCLTGTMSDGTQTRHYSVANNFLPLGTQVEIRPNPYGRRAKFYVRDHIGWGTQLDFWQPTCSQARAWGRRTVRMRVWRPRHKVDRAKAIKHTMRVRTTFGGTR